MNHRNRNGRGLRQFALILALSGVFAAVLAAFSGGNASSVGTSSLPTSQQSSSFIIPPDIGFIADIFPTTTTTLSVNGLGTGNGNVSSIVNGGDLDPLNCQSTAGAESGDCSDSYTWVLIPPTITLTAAANAGSTFVGWGDAGATCGSSVTCDIAMGSDATVTATFDSAPGNQPLTVTMLGTGGGTVSGPGISCLRSGGVQSGDCAQDFTTGTLVTLSAAAAPGSDFSGSWGGACASFGSSPTCTVTMDAAKSVTATFSTQTFLLTVSISGSGNGVVASSPAGIACVGSAGAQAGDCSESYASGTVVTLTAAAGQGSTFSGTWSGACGSFGASPTCTIPIDAAKSATAEFKTAGGGGGGAGGCTITGTAASEDRKSTRLNSSHRL